MPGTSNEDMEQLIRADWLHLIHKKGILRSANYMKENGKAVVVLQGGFLYFINNEMVLQNLFKRLDGLNISKTLGYCKMSSDTSKIPHLVGHM